MDVLPDKMLHYSTLRMYTDSLVPGNASAVISKHISSKDSLNICYEIALRWTLRDFTDD